MSVEIAWGRQRDRVRTTQAADHRTTLCWLARYAVVVCLSVRPSKTGVVSKRVDNSSWFFGMEAFFAVL